MKISVIGPSGSGKSELTRKISKQFDLPRLEIDRLWFTCGGYELFLRSGTDEDEIKVDEKIKASIQQFLAEHNDWVIDGSYIKFQNMIADEADQLVFIKRPLVNRVLSHLLRIFRGRDRHPETTKWQDVKFIKTIIRRWRKNENTKLENFVKDYEEKLIRLNSFKEIDHYFDSIIE